MSDVVFESLNASFGMTPKQYEKYTELMNTPSGEWPEPGKTELFGFPDGLFVRLGISRDWVVENIAMYVVKHYPDPPAAPDSSIPRPLAELAEARERIRELEAENRHMEMTLIWIWVTTRDPIIEARLINEYPSIAEKGTADSPQP